MNAISDFNKYTHQALAILIGLFVILKIPYLSYGFFWDEAWVYGKSVLYFVDHGIQFFPSLETVDLTRGHPMLFHFLASSWAYILGSSNTVLHLFPLLISVILILSLFFCVSNISKEKSPALIAAVFLIGNEIFFVQSGLILPEILLALFIFLSFYYLLIERYLLFTLFFIFSLYTKESGVVLFAFVAYLISYKLWINKILDYKAIIGSLCAFIIISLFFLYQKKLFGWYFFPKHIEIMNFEFSDFEEKFTLFFNGVFNRNFHYLLTAVFIGGLSYLLYKSPGNKKKRIILMSFLMIDAVVILLKDITGFHTMVPNFLLLIIIFFVIQNIQFHNYKLKLCVLHSWVLLSGYLVWISFHFYSLRYVIPIIVLYSVVWSSIVNECIRLKNLRLISFSSFMLILLFFCWYRSAELTDVDTNYKSALVTNNQIVDYFLEEADTSSAIRADFLELEVLSNSYCGFVSKSQEFTNVNTADDSLREFNVITNLAGKLSKKKQFFDTSKWKVVKNIENDLSEALIYTLKEE